MQCHNACLQEGFAGSDENETSTFDFRAFSNDSDKKYVLEVDLEYPRGLHGQHNAYPLDPERLRVCREWISQYQIDLGEDLGRSSVDVDKLVPSLNNNIKYMLHYRNRKLCLSLGMRLKRSTG